MSNPTIMQIPTTFVVIQGDTHFDVTWDMFGMNKVTQIDWGTMPNNVPKSVVFYITNKDPTNLLVALSKKDPTWSPSNLDAEVGLTWDFGTNPISGQRIRKVNLTMTLLATLPPLVPPATIYIYTTLLTGSVA